MKATFFIDENEVLDPKNNIERFRRIMSFKMKRKERQEVMRFNRVLTVGKKGSSFKSR